MQECIKKVVVSSMLFAAVATFAATPTVTDVVAKQRFPWNGLVDITCKVTGIDIAANEFHLFSVSTVMPDSGDVRSASTLWIVQNGTNSTDRLIHTNGNYRLVWDAQTDLGQVIYSNIIVRVTIVTFRDKVQLWEGGPYWSCKNIGAHSPWEYGYYFWWGDTIGYKRENDVWVAIDGSSSNFDFDNAQTRGKDIDTLRNEGWITADGVLVPEHDAAHVHWGGKWRMPTKQELSDLNNKCDFTWTTMNGVKGCLVSGKGDYESSSIFFPAAGFGHYILFDAYPEGFFWSSVPYTDKSRAWFLYIDFNEARHGVAEGNVYLRKHGFSVRPVQGFTE